MIHIRNISHQVDQVKVSHGAPRLPQQNHISIRTGDVAVSNTPVVLETLLGSCVAVCLFDPILQVGGMNHILLPGSLLDPKSTRFGVNAMELLINEMMKHGGDRRRFLAKAFGGANVMHDVSCSAIGDENAHFVCHFLATERIPLVAQRLGGTQSVRLDFRTNTGKATVHTIDGSRLQKLIHAEEAYRRAHLADREFSGEITLF